MLTRTSAIIALCLIWTTAAWSQSPFQFNFQAVARNLAGNPLTNQSVDFRLSVLQGAMDGTAVYVEEQPATTNNFGLANLLVGSGTPSLGSLSAVDWANGPYFLQIELDIQNGEGYQLMGTSALASVPYALHAKTSEQAGPEGPQGEPGEQGEAGANGQSAYELWLSLGNEGTEEDFLASLVGPQGEPGSGGSSGFTHFLGEAFGGGIVFHLWLDPITGEEHGLVVCPELFPNAKWGYNGIQVNVTSRTNGMANLDSVRVIGVEPNTIWSVVDTLNYSGYSDWYIPARHEAQMLANNALFVQNSMAQLGYPPFLQNGDIYYQHGGVRMWTSSKPPFSGVATAIAWDPNDGFRGSSHTASSNSYWSERSDTMRFFPIRRF